jgi:hypothetical protein
MARFYVHAHLASRSQFAAPPATFAYGGAAMPPPPPRYV